MVSLWSHRNIILNHIYWLVFYIFSWEISADPPIPGLLDLEISDTELHEICKSMGTSIQKSNWRIDTVLPHYYSLGTLITLATLLFFRSLTYDRTCYSKTFRRCSCIRFREICDSRKWRENDKRSPRYTDELSALRILSVGNCEKMDFCAFESLWLR